MVAPKPSPVFIAQKSRINTTRRVLDLDPGLFFYAIIRRNSSENQAISRVLAELGVGDTGYGQRAARAI